MSKGRREKPPTQLIPRGTDGAENNPRPCSAAKGSGGLVEGLSPTLPIWVGVCARRQGLTAEQQRKRRARVCKHTRAHTHAHACPVARRATAGRQGDDAGASSPWRGAGRGGHGCRPPRSGRRRVRPFHPGSARRGAHPPACSCPSLLCLVPASPAAAPAGFYGNSAGKHDFQQGHRQPQHPKSRQRAAPSRGLLGRHLCPALPAVPSPQPLSPRGQPGTWAG